MQIFSSAAKYYSIKDITCSECSQDSSHDLACNNITISLFPQTHCSPRKRTKNLATDFALELQIE